ncbi:hypothetical protein [Specibacter cremeus]|uniref:hypothetical protein n=1 Tax=Specibacter cremeus TaxID=1629051 RepID=UPI000F77B09A|nr:hypothetical protein [Specibacter cremeus]
MVWTVIVFALALLMFLLSVIAVAFWTPIDDSFVNRADAAGDISLLLPHQMGLWFVLHVLNFVAFLLSVFAFVTMWQSRRERPSVQSSSPEPDQLRAATQRQGSAR